MPSILKKLGSASLAASFLVSWQAVSPGSAAADSVVLTGHIPKQIRAAAKLERAPADENVDLGLVVRIDTDLMARTLASLYGPNAPRNKRFLSSAEFARQFDLARKRQALKDFAAGAGLTVSSDDKPGSLVVKVSGPSSRVENAFGVRLYHYRSADGQVFRANDADPTVPSALAPHLNAVVGLSNFHGAKKPRLKRGRPVSLRSKAGASSASGAAGPATVTGTGPLGGLAPADIKSIYGLSGLLNGSGQTLALLELDGFAPADIGLYETQFSLASPTVTCTSADGSCGECGTSQNQTCNATTLASDGGMIEVALDIEMVIALAPGVSKVLVYTGLNTDAGLLTAYSDIASDNTAKAVSSSWGEDEEDAYDGSSSFMTSESEVFAQMATQGQTMFSAAGDAGAYDSSGNDTCGTHGNQACSWNATLLTDDPASQPYVTGVGGTSLSGTIGGSITETVWNEGCSSASSPGTKCAEYGAGGGGVAGYVGGSTTYWPLPSYQSGVAGIYSATNRNVPDVALNADPDAAPYSICIGGTCSQCDDTTCTTLIGGTSAAAPLWGALTALINQQRATNGLEPLGFANTALYQLGTGSSRASFFNDITSGNNGYYSAGTGYDNASGWGSFKANALIAQLGTPPAPASAVTGLTAFTLGISSIQYSWSALTGATGYDLYYATNTSQPLRLATQPPFTQTGLIGDEVSGVLVYGEDLGVEGPGVSITTATYAAAPGAAPVATGFTSSAAFTYSGCPAFPNPSSCSGYEVQVSTDSGFTGTVFSSASLNAVPATLQTTGLSTFTGYFARLAYLNPNGAPTFGPYGTFNTGGTLVAPVSPSFSGIGTGAIDFTWQQGSNPSGLTYVAEASTAPDYSGTLLQQTGTAFSSNFSGLSSDTSWYFRVQGVGGPFLDAGPEATLAAAPGAPANAFTSVGATSFALSWSSGGNQPDTLYQTDVSLAANFTPVAVSQQVRGPAASFTGLTANTHYYARVEAIGRLGVATIEVSLGSTTTLVTAPTLPVQPFSGQTANGFTFTFNQADPAGTVYSVLVSTDPGFSVIAAASDTASSAAAFTGLFSNQLYNVEVAALNSAGVPSAYTAAVATATLVAAPLAAAVPVTTETAAGLGIAWAAGSLAPGTTYAAQVSSSPAFGAAGFVVTTSVTANAFAAFAGLQPNTTYYGQVQAQSRSLNPNSPFLSAATAATLTNPPTAASAPFLLLSFTSATVAWKSLPLAPSSAATEGYLVQFATVPDFSAVAATASAGPGGSSATVSGLDYATSYYARVGALNWEGTPNYLALGSTVTALPPLSSGTVSASGITLTVPPSFSQFGAITVYVPPGAFPAGTPISAVANVAVLPPAVTNEASSIVPFGSNVGLVLSANGLQPAAPVTITMPYDFTQIPAGQSESRLELWRYDPVALQWTLIPSQVDASDHALTAQTPHFSTFAPFFVAAGADVSDVQVFPQPWEIGDSASQYWASVLTLSGLPDGATVKIFTIRGELVWSGTAAASGVLTWDGGNRFGRRAASGTYFASFQNDGRTKVRRLVIIR